MGNLRRRKLSRISRFCSYPRKVLCKIGRLGILWQWHQAIHKSFLCENHISAKSRKFSPSKVSRYTVCEDYCVREGGRGRWGKRRKGRREGGRKGGREGEERKEERGYKRGREEGREGTGCQGRLLYAVAVLVWVYVILRCKSLKFSWQLTL